jgi:molybdopterin converting factor small subunit
LEVTVKYFGLVRNSIGKKEELIQLPAGASVRELLDVLVSKYGETVRDLVLTADGNLSAEAILMLDGEDIRNGDELKTRLDGAVEAHLVVLAPAALGGTS